MLMERQIFWNLVIVYYAMDQREFRVVFIFLLGLHEREPYVNFLTTEAPSIVLECKTISIAPCKQHCSIIRVAPSALSLVLCVEKEPTNRWTCPSNMGQTASSSPQTPTSSNSPSHQPEPRCTAGGSGGERLIFDVVEALGHGIRKQTTMLTELNTLSYEQFRASVNELNELYAFGIVRLNVTTYGQKKDRFINS